MKHQWLLIAISIVIASCASPTPRPAVVAAISTAAVQSAFATLTAIAPSPTPTAPPATETPTPLPLPTRRPDYIKEVVVYKEGIDGVAIYFVLADSDGNEIASDGQVTLTIYSKPKPTYEVFGNLIETYLHRANLQVRSDSFRETVVGVGVFARLRLIYPFGRISYSSFQTKSAGLFRETVPDSGSGLVTIEFTAIDGRVLKGEDTFFW